MNSNYVFNFNFDFLINGVVNYVFLCLFLYRVYNRFQNLIFPLDLYVLMLKGLKYCTYWSEGHLIQLYTENIFLNGLPVTRVFLILSC